MTDIQSSPSTKEGVGVIDSFMQLSTFYLIKCSSQRDKKTVVSKIKGLDARKSLFDSFDELRLKSVSLGTENSQFSKTLHVASYAL